MPLVLPGAEPHDEAPQAARQRERLDDAVRVQGDDGVVAAVGAVGRVAHEEPVGQGALVDADPEEPADPAARAVRADDEGRGDLDGRAVGIPPGRADDSVRHADGIRVEPGERHAAAEGVGCEAGQPRREDRLRAPLRQGRDVRVRGRDPGE